MKINNNLRKYIEENIFPKYLFNDKGHGIDHINEVIRRSFELNENLNLNLDQNIIYTIAAYHDIGKHLNSEIHERISAEFFYRDDEMHKFFNDQQRKTIKEAIEDHRSSNKNKPRSIYGELISSADRNSKIELVFIRSFLVAHERTPDMIIEDYLDYTFKRLSRRYSEEAHENMFLEDDKYKKFLIEMRKLLKDEKSFKDKYCSVNNIKSRMHMVFEEPGVAI